MHFSDIYVPHQYALDVQSKDLDEVTSGDSFTVDLYNADSSVVSDSIKLALQDGTFQVTWPGQTALTTRAELEANPLVLSAYTEIRVTVSFLDSGRDFADQVDFEWAEVSVPVSFERYVVVLEKPQRNVVEDLEFKTDVAEAWDGTERRTRVRATPRSTLQLEYLVNAEDRQTGIAFQAKMMGLAGRRAKVALWHKTQSVDLATLDFLNGRVVLRVDHSLCPELSDIKAGDLIWYYRNSDGQIGKGVANADSTETQVFVTAVPAPDFYTEVQSGDVTLLPMAIGYLKEDTSVDLYPSGATKYSATWVVPYSPTYQSNYTDDSELWRNMCGDDPNSDLYGGRPILREGQYVKNSLGISSDSGSIWFDQAIGTIDTLNRKDAAAISFGRIFDFSYESKLLANQGAGLPATIYRPMTETLRRFVHWTWGRQRSFWTSSGSEDLIYLSADATGLSGTFYGDDMGVLTPLLDGYSHLEATFSDGTTKRTQVISADTDGTNATLTFDSNQVFVTASELAADPNVRISILYHVRLASDKIKFKYNGNEEVSCQVNVVTVKQ
jgi:hypothetical protein